MKYHIERSIIIDADFKKVRGLVEDFKHWDSWSPWTIVEPGCKSNVKGDVGKVGHEMSWDGEIIGSGINTIESVDGNSINYDLRFIKPFKSQAKTGFVFEEVSGGTKVSWTMDSSMPFFLFFMIPSMKAWIGMDYDRGLKMLKELAEKGKVDVDTTNEGLKPFEGFSYVGIKRTCSFENISKEMPADFDTLIKEVVLDRGLSAKHWVSLYPKMDIKTGMMTYIAAVSDEHLEDVDLDGDFVRGEIESSQVLEIKHRGSYEFIGNAWSMGMMYLRAKKIKQQNVPFEYYWNSPKEVQPNELKTSIYFPVKGE